MISGILGFKLSQSQTFSEDGKRIPVTVIQTGSCSVVQIKNVASDGYVAVQLGLGTRKIKTTTKPLQGHIKKAGIGEKNLPRFLREIRLDDEVAKDQEQLKPGLVIAVGDIFRVGDRVRITGTSKGKGFAGVVKRHHFRGGPRTHGQSDRERAPGAIGQTTTPGRVYKGKRMAGHMGVETVTVTNLPVISIDPEKSLLMVGGLVPGPIGGPLTIIKGKSQ